MDGFAVIPAMLCPNSIPVKTHADHPGTRLPSFTGRAAMQSIHNDRPSMSATSGPASFSVATVADDPMATTHGQPQTPDVQGSPLRPIRHIICPGAPKKQLPSKSFRARTEAANSDNQSLFTPLAPLRHASAQDTVAYNIAKLTSRANSVDSAQDLLNRLNWVGNTATVEGSTNTTIKAALGEVSVLHHDDGVDNELETSVASLGRLTPAKLPRQAGVAPRQSMTRGAIASCSHAEGSRLKRVKSTPTFGEAATAGVSSFKAVARMNGHLTQHALEGIQQDQGCIKADDPVDPVLKGLGRNRGGGHQPLPSLNSLDRKMALGKSSGKTYVSSVAPQAMLPFTQGSNSACTQTRNRGHYFRGQISTPPCALPARVPKHGRVEQDAGLSESIVPLTQASNFFPNDRQQLFVSSFNLPMDPSLPTSLRPFFNLPQL